MPQKKALKKILKKMLVKVLNLLEAPRTAMMAHHECAHVFLANVSDSHDLVSDKFRKQRECRVVLDNGSQVNFISRKPANLLMLPAKKASLPISGKGSTQA